jgi:hypothetical protein
MLIFRMDEVNFAAGLRDGTRVVTDQGLKVDFNEFAPDANTLGLWHLHNGGCRGEGTGLEDASGGGHTLINYGAAVCEDGYRFVQSENDRMICPGFSFGSPQNQLTVECWVRDWEHTDSYANIFIFLRTTAPTNRLELFGRLDGANSYLYFALTINGAVVGYAGWTGNEVAALLASAEPWHVAVVLEAPARCCLYVNGVKRAEDTTGILALQSGTYSLIHGSYGGGAPSCVMDETRLSTAARYAANFSPARLRAAGTYVSPTFNSDRIQSVWADLVCTQALPSGTAAAWEVRAADELDGFNDPQAVWQSYGGDPAALPDGRYFQWRVTLSAAADRRVSPTVESVEALASTAGYTIYHAAGPDPETLDYFQPWARVGPGVTQFTTGPLDAGTVHWFGIRPTDPREIESPVTETELRLELDPQGARVPDRPLGVLALIARPLPLGAVRLDWRWRAGTSGVVPQAFRIFGDGGTGEIDYDAPLGEVPYGGPDLAYAWTSGALAEGAEHQLAVRAVAAGGTWDEQPAIVRVTPDASAPGQVDAIEAEVIP